MGVSPGQLVVTFSADEKRELLSRVELIAKLSFAGNKSMAAKTLMRAAFGDPVACATVQAILNMEQMKDFRAGAALGLPELATP